MMVVILSVPGNAPVQLVRHSFLFTRQVIRAAFEKAVAGVDHQGMFRNTDAFTFVFFLDAHVCFT
ncbi:hypothetical protein SDC9_114168 [bioreactor metagenome]|uniref:Uncharacterized protein n=1 Tax=bioreactor metagenome TaxID=1076179 RepID=A0A645BPR7_9ZZZZ